MTTDAVRATRVDQPAEPAPDRPQRLLPDVTLGSQLGYSPIVLAAPAGPEGAGPVRVAAALQQRYGSVVSAVRVMDISNVPLPTPLPAAFTMARELIGDAPYAEDAQACRRQMGDWLGRPNDWPVRISLGAPAYEILRYAERQGAALIIMGLRRHGIVDRVLRDETTLTVARRARAAVLGVVPTLPGLPRRAIVGVDFGPASIRAARAALDVLATPTPDEPVTLRLVYVDQTAVEPKAEDTAGASLIRHLGVAAAFDQLVNELNAPPGVHVDCVVRHGAPGAELLACADESSAGLIAVGSLRHERVERWMVGSVTTEIVRDGRCSVLVIPPVQAA